jgi:hypothetical protein
VTFGGKWQGIRRYVAGTSDADSLGGGQLSTSHDADDERFACCLDDFLGDDREVVDVQDASVITQLDDALAHVRA